MSPAEPRAKTIRTEKALHRVANEATDGDIRKDEPPATPSHGWHAAMWLLALEFNAHRNPLIQIRNASVDEGGYNVNNHLSVAEPDLPFIPPLPALKPTPEHTCRSEFRNAVTEAGTVLGEPIPGQAIVRDLSPEQADAFLEAFS